MKKLKFAVVGRNFIFHLAFFYNLGYSLVIDYFHGGVMYKLLSIILIFFLAFSCNTETEFGGEGKKCKAGGICNNGMVCNANMVCEKEQETGECKTGDIKRCGEHEIGICKKGSSSCVNNSWGECIGKIDPILEICSNNMDDDCDGEIDEIDCVTSLDCTLKCSKNEMCELQNNEQVCVCKNSYYLDGDTCKYDCRNTPHSVVNEENNACDCESDYYLDSQVNKCLLKVGCMLEEAKCDNGTCKEDLEKDWYCECNNNYYFDVNIKKCVEKSICEDDRIKCGDNCCLANQICLNGNKCQTLADENCQNDNECEENFYCDPVVNKCIEIDKADSCTFKPPFTQKMTPLIAWQWPNENTANPSFKNVMMTPVIANMTDDNNDGVIDLKDTPDVIFTSFNNHYNHALLRIIDGKSGNDIDTDSEDLDGGSAISVGDIDNDNKNEIVVIDSSRRKVIVFEYDNNSDLVKKWSSDFLIINGQGAGASSIADIDHDGKPEIIVGNYIFNGEDGSEHCHLNSSLVSYGHNKWKRHVSIVEDINNDGTMDIITGNQLISGIDCSRIAAREDRNDGFTAIADLDNNGKPEIVVVSEGVLYIYNKDMEDLITPLAVDTGDPIGGPPTIANFDDDSDLEIAVAGTTEYRVLNVDLGTETASILWAVATNDASSRMTGSSLFDFEGDGIAEVLYADECHFRIYNGKDGSERFKTKNSSGTVLEYPLVVDVDNDGKSEVIVTSNNYGGIPNWQSRCGWGTPNGTNGVRMFESPDNSWVRTRRIWNQHSYHVTNINEDGSVPRNEEHNWEIYNNYRLNTQGKGVFNAPNFVTDNIEITRTDCPKLSFHIKIQISNKGSLPINSGLPVSIYQVSANSKILLTTLFTSEMLLPGDIITMEHNFTPTKENKVYTLSIVVDDKGNGEDEYNECNESDNSKTITFKGSYSKFCQVGKGECMKFAPYTCNADGELSCNASPEDAVDEICNDGLDNDCDEQIDEGCGCSDSQECYSAASDFIGKGVCKKGTMSCIGGENWSECSGDILPSVESCNGLDDDCDGEVDEDFANLNNECYLGLGICRTSGVYVCDDAGNMICNAVVGTPELEVCNDGLDNNCNGQTDEKPCRE